MSVLHVDSINAPARKATQLAAARNATGPRSQHGGDKETA
jgi:hypothetical protein